MAALAEAVAIPGTTEPVQEAVRVMRSEVEVGWVEGDQAAWEEGWAEWEVG